MDYNQPNPPEQPPAGGQPTPPPYQPYGQPGQAPPPQQPYQPSQQPYPPQSYQPPAPPYGGYAPPPQKRGPNWLAICGITCVVLVIVVGACGYLVARPFLAIGMEITQATESVASTDLATIQAGATLVKAEDLAANPSLFKGQWIELTGVVSGTQMTGASDPFNSRFNKEGGTSYYLEQGIMLQDLSNRPPQGQTGSPVRAWGKVAYIDLASMPFIKQALEEQATQDPNAAMPTTFVMFFAKEIEITGDPAPAPDPNQAPANADPPAGGEGKVSGWN